MSSKIIQSLSIFAVPLLVSCAWAQDVRSSLESESGSLRVETVADGLSSPWGAVFLPDGSMLVTERSGTLRRVSAEGEISSPIQGTPEVVARGQGGLLDVALDPQFDQNRLVYLTFSEAHGEGAGTSAGRGRLNEDATAIENFEVIFRQEPAVSGGNHFGSRLAFSPDGHLFVTMGDRFDHMQEAQNISNHLGKLVRISPDGSIPQDNPFVGRDGADEIWSYGHRNVQGAAIHPDTGELWIAELGPRGGDEVNIPKSSENYGWPLVSPGRHYSGEPIPDPSTRPELAGAIYSWNPVISPSGIAFVTSDAFPDWRGDLLLAGLSSQAIVRLDLEGQRAVGEERIDMGARIRDVLFGPDGQLYALTDGEGGAVIRISRQEG